MKTCPDCAESIQDAARKCRYCGYRFDEAPTRVAAGGDGDDDGDPAASAAIANVVAATGSSRPSIGFLFVALGASAIAIGALVGVVGVAALDQSHGTGVAWVNLIGLVGGGVVLAAGWGITSARGQGGAGGLFGALALVAGQVLGAYLGSGDSPLVTGLITSAGMLACLVLHLGTLEEVGFDGTRLCAMLGIVGVGGLLFSFVNQWELAAWLASTLAWCGVGGIVLFGLALAIAAVLHLRDG